VPADERLSDPRSDGTTEVVQAGQQPGVVLSVVLSSNELPEKVPEERKEAQDIKQECPESLSGQFLGCVFVDDIPDSPAPDTALQDG
jgi:hypothetical protein